MNREPCIHKETPNIDPHFDDRPPIQVEIILYGLIKSFTSVGNPTGGCHTPTRGNET